jgi:hypothetical protein
MARMWVGMIELRDQLFLLGHRGDKEDLARRFDRNLTPLIESAEATRDAGTEIRTLVAGHNEAIRSGSAVRITETQVDINESIDKQLGQAVDKLLNQSIVTTKTCLQRILRDPLNLDIGFMYGKDGRFRSGIADLRARGQIDLADYLEAVRANWHSGLQALRDGTEHQALMLGDYRYRQMPGNPITVEPVVPKVFGQDVDEFAQLAANRVLLFVENMMVYAMQQGKTRFPLVVVEIPPEARDPVSPKRFRVVPRGLGPPVRAWRIEFFDSPDFV